MDAMLRTLVASKEGARSHVPSSSHERESKLMSDPCQVQRGYRFLSVEGLGGGRQQIIALAIGQLPNDCCEAAGSRATSPLDRHSLDERQHRGPHGCLLQMQTTILVHACVIIQSRDLLLKM